MNAFARVRRSLVLLLPLTFLISHLVASRSLAETFTLYTENNPPFQIVVDGKPKGPNVDIIRELFRRTGLAYVIKLDSWQKSFYTAMNSEYHGVFATIRSASREKKFHWVGPISYSSWTFMAKKGSGIDLNTVDDAKKYRVGGYIADAKVEFLKKKGFQIIEVEDDKENAAKLAAGKIDLWATGASGEYYAKQQGLKNLESIFTFREITGYLALNRSVPLGVVNKLQTTIDLMRKEGLLRKTLKIDTETSDKP
jgi:polar amino acid transport system substrate-binding protein